VLAETVNGYYKAELIRGPAREGRPWKTVEDVELATLGWVHWHNHDRLHGYLDDVPPAEFEEAFYATKRTDQALTGLGNRALLADELTTGPRSTATGSHTSRRSGSCGSTAPST